VTTPAAPPPSDPLRALVETVLYEGYVLYPYGARSDKNRVRFQWGVLGPPGADRDGACESPRAHVECIVAADTAAEITVTVRFLQTQERTLEVDGPTGPSVVDELTVDGALQLPWTESVEREVTIGPTPLLSLLGGMSEPIAAGGGDDVEVLTDAGGATVGRVRRRRWALDGEVAVRSDPADVADRDGRSLWRIAVTVENRAPWQPGGTREQALRRALVATHVVLHATGGRFVSSQDPPSYARDAVAACRGERLWPVLIGRDDTVLAAPIILYDHPQLAPESPGDHFDATEIDELLTLRVLTLTDDEKREARATDRRAAAIVDRADTLPPEVFARLHGAVRSLGPRRTDRPATDAADSSPQPGGRAPWWDPAADASVSPGSDSVEVDGVQVAAGSRVRLVPSRRADAQDLFVAGLTATVAAVVFDVDGGTHLAVTVDDDPAADLHDWYGRYLYFGPDEVRPLEPTPEEAPS
jgi:hypothetical protein